MKPKPHALLYTVFFIAILTLPSLLQRIGIEGNGRYQIGVLNDIGLYLSLALSLNIILGNCGLFSMGHAAFFGIGAYTTAIVNIHLGIPIFMALPLAGIVAGLVGFLVIVPMVHLRGDYLMLITIGVMEIIRIALLNDIFGITGGASGIFGISRPEFFGITLKSPSQLYYLIWGFAFITIILFSLLDNSRFGRALNYIKHDEVAATGTGINVNFYKISAFTLGAFWAGLVGTLFAAKMRAIDPEAFTFSESVFLFAIVILGGAGSIPGVILGSFLLIGLPEMFREFSSARMLIFGAIMVLMMIFRPQGLLPSRKKKYKVSGLVEKNNLSIANKLRRSDNEPTDS